MPPTCLAAIHPPSWLATAGMHLHLYWRTHTHTHTTTSQNHTCSALPHDTTFVCTRTVATTTMFIITITIIVNSRGQVPVSATPAGRLILRFIHSRTHAGLLRHVSFLAKP